VARDADAPRMPVAVYSGILLNLYTNALKAILAVKSTRTEQKILIHAYNDGKTHIVDVMDTGIGIPPNIRKRVWDPLFTTTSSDDNPFGAGMGLGLSLVKALVESRKGRVVYPHVRIPTPCMNFGSVVLGLAADHLGDKAFSAILKLSRGAQLLKWQANCGALQRSFAGNVYLPSYHWYE
jgi:hypothetical protein